MMRATSSSNTTVRGAITPRPGPDARAHATNVRVPPDPAQMQDIDPLAVDPTEMAGAAAFLADLLGMGCSFELLDENAIEWFGPAEATTPKLRCRVLFWKAELLALLREGARSRRTWGEPTVSDWLHVVVPRDQGAT